MASELHPPPTAVREAVARALAEDLGPLGDVTAALVPMGTVATARVVPREDGVLAGVPCATEAFALVEPALQVRWFADDGAEITKGEPIGEVRGELAPILTAERTALNFLCHLSGVATLTRRYVRAARGRARIRDTRKTTPGLRALEKAAVRAGGGVNHRGDLSDGILVKDNHLARLSITDAVRRARLRWPGRAVQVECDSPEQVAEAVAAGAELILCDNMAPATVRECVALVAGRALVEVSGGVTLETVAAYADAGADLISVGALTHSAPALDIGLDIEAEA
jgi:nicotinate-nucleotide pyrophosphorylase (carboxylating)